MTESRLINSSDLENAGIDSLLEAWGAQNNVINELVSISDLTYTIPNTSGYSYILNGPASQTLTIPLNTSNIQTGRNIEILYFGDFDFSIEPDTDVTLNFETGLFPFYTKYGVIKLKKIASDEWLAYR